MNVFSDSKKSFERKNPEKHKTEMQIKSDTSSVYINQIIRKENVLSIFIYFQIFSESSIGYVLDQLQQIKIAVRDKELIQVYVSANYNQL